MMGGDLIDTIVVDVPPPPRRYPNYFTRAERWAARRLMASHPFTKDHAYDVFERAALDKGNLWHVNIFVGL